MFFPFFLLGATIGEIESWYKMIIYPSIHTTMPKRADNSIDATLALDSTPSLGEFLRVHRERLTPQQAGMPAGTRRRTPGLRREEVAQLCGVSTTWYTWIEQGRPVSASPEALARIASALKLSKAERAYLFALANLHDPEAVLPVTSEVPTALASTLRLLKTPAYVLDRQWNAVGWNSQAKLLFSEWLGTGDDRNLLRYIFLSPEARHFIVDWETRARRIVAEFRADAGRFIHQEPTRSLLQRLLQQSSSFRRFWNSQDVFEREGGLRNFAHPKLGSLTYDQITMKPAAHEELKLVILTPVLRDK